MESKYILKVIGHSAVVIGCSAWVYLNQEMPLVMAYMLFGVALAAAFYALSALKKI